MLYMQKRENTPFRFSLFSCVYIFFRSFKYYYDDISSINYSSTIYSPLSLGINTLDYFVFISISLVFLYIIYRISNKSLFILTGGVLVLLSIQIMNDGFMNTNNLHAVYILSSAHKEDISPKAEEFISLYLPKIIDHIFFFATTFNLFNVLSKKHGRITLGLLGFYYILSIEITAMIINKIPVHYTAFIFILFVGVICAFYAAFKFKYNDKKKTFSIVELIYILTAIFGIFQVFNPLRSIYLNEAKKISNEIAYIDQKSLTKESCQKATDTLINNLGKVDLKYLPQEKVYLCSQYNQIKEIKDHVDDIKKSAPPEDPSPYLRVIGYLFIITAICLKLFKVISELLVAFNFTSKKQSQ